MGRYEAAEESRGNIKRTTVNKKELKEQLKKGYSEMADLNLKLAKEGLKAEQESYPKF